MRLASGVNDQYIYFVAVDATDFTTRETGLTTFTVYRSRNGGAAAAMTTPTINETDATNMPGVYELLVDEDVTIDSGDETQEICYHITHAGMAPVTRTIELFRPKITAGNTLDVTSTGEAGLDFANVNLPAGAIPALGIIDSGTAQSATGTTLVLRSAAAFANDELIGATIVITGGSAGVGQARVITDYVGSTDTATVDTWTTTPTGTITYIVVAGSPASASLVPAVNVTQIGGDAQSATDLKDFADAGYDPSTNKVQGVVLADAVTTVNGLAANVITAAATAADFTTEIQSGLATAAALTTVDDFLDTEIAAIKAKTDSLTFTTAGIVDANIQQINDVTITGNGGTGTEFDV